MSHGRRLRRRGGLIISRRQLVFRDGICRLYSVEGTRRDLQRQIVVE